MQKQLHMKFIAHFLLFVVIFISLTNSAEGQVYKWRKLRYELIAGGGVSNFMSDVGEAENSGLSKYFWTNVNTWRPVGVIGMRMAFSDRHKAKAVLSTGFLYANDAYGAWPENQYEVRTSITEISAQYEFYIIREQKKRNIYNFLGASQRFRNFVLPTYLFAGISGVYFNPKTLFDDEWVALRQYNTEVLPNGKETYFPVALAIPVGIGIQFKIAKYISVNIEAGWRLAFTDYMDDLGHGDYPDLEEAIANGDYTRAALSYRGHGFDRMSDQLRQSLEEYVPSGSRSVGEWYDQYQFVTATLNFKLKTGRKGQPRLRLYR
ncbi:hypothetical protein L21SP5_02948 [Salinivirga cyanobacteriivorans]|uniref:DUF6089 domain-containing protein n=2 Tax=Salinivirga cyanobacteriivorans TaxID=1307839 RepID=A0A0S2I2B0_9BACT|nr:hypothetical protein L21SP5_02948 [Salinivirga cyanobacteriivorans]